MSARNHCYASLPVEAGEPNDTPAEEQIEPGACPSEDHEEAADEHERVPAAPSHLLTFTNGLALVVGLQIGSGVFTAPSQVSQHTTSPVVAVSVWIFGGLLVWTGAASFIELGLSIPRNGGIQEYLHACYGDFPAFLFSWIWTTIVKPCAMAMVSIVFAENLCRGLFPAAVSSPGLVKAVALAGFILIILVNCKGTRTGALAGNVFLLLKLFTIFSVALLGIGTLVLPSPSKLDNPPLEESGVGASNVWSFVGNYVIALFGVLFCYGGWETVGFVAGDMKDPIRDLPRVINTAMSLVIIGFALMASSLYIVLPMQSLRDTDTPIVDFADALFGVFGRRLYSVIASICALGALHANVFTTARLCIAAADRSYLPRLLQPKQGQSEANVMLSGSIFDKLPSALVRALSVTIRLTRASEDGVPPVAIFFSGFPALLFIVMGTFRGLVVFYGISEYIFFSGTALGVFRLRKQLGSDMLYRTSSANPIIFSFISAMISLRGILNDPVQGIVIALMGIMGFVLYKWRFLSNT